MLKQLLTNRNNDDTSDNQDREENRKDETPEDKHSKESSLINVVVIKDIQAQITSLTQQDELKNVGDDSSLPDGMKFSYISTKIQAINFAFV